MLNEIMEKGVNPCKTLDQDKLKEAPNCGYILVYFQTGLELGTYQKVMCSKDGSKTIDIKAACLDQEKYKNGAKLLELHLFDKKTEYRAIYTANESENRYRECIIHDKNIQNTQEEEKKEKAEYQLLYGSTYEYSEERGGILAAQDGNAKFFYLPDPQGYDLYLKVINYIDFDDDDMLVINNYRLAGIYMRKKEEEWTYLWA